MNKTSSAKKKVVGSLRDGINLATKNLSTAKTNTGNDSIEQTKPKIKNIMLDEESPASSNSTKNTKLPTSPRPSTVASQQKKSSQSTSVKKLEINTPELEQKLKILHELGQPELIDMFREWQPQRKKRKISAPLDQRVTLNITDSEKVFLNNDLLQVKNSATPITASQFIRNRALATADIEGWRNIALQALKEIDETVENQAAMRQRRIELESTIENTEDSEDLLLLEKEAAQLDKKIGRLLAAEIKRKNRLSGRVSYAEAEMIRWRAQRLCISASDYLRIMIFALSPDSLADSHMSLDSKRRFYISIIDVAENGWGSPPTIYNCSQCANYLEEINRLQDRVKQLEMFV